MGKITVTGSTIGLYNDFKAKTRDQNKVILRQWRRKAVPLIKSAIVKTIQIGNSPVQGFGRFQDYSKMYKSAILGGEYTEYNKKLRPINMTLTGQMLKSLTSRATVNGFLLQFTSRLAEKHNELGVGKYKVIRRILPVHKGERLKDVIFFEAGQELVKLTKFYYSKLLK